MTREDGVRSYHEVRVTKGLKSKEEADALSDFVGEHVNDFQGETQQGYAITEEHFRIPKVVFSSSDRAFAFADEVAARFGISRENVVVKPKLIKSHTSDVPKLIDELKCDDGIRCRKARLALVKLGSVAIPALIEATKNTNSTVRWEGLKALSQIGGQKAIDTLVDHLGDNDGRGWVAADGLTRIGRRAVIPVMEALVSHSGLSDFREGAHHFLSKLLIDDQAQTTLEPVTRALEGSESSLEAPIAARKAIIQFKIELK